MSGVITNGVQWEHCNHCGNFVKLHDLHMGYSPKWPEHDAVDLCPKCYQKLIDGKFRQPIIKYIHWNSGCLITPYKGNDPQVAGDFCYIRGII